MKKSATERKKKFLQNPHHRPCIAHNVVYIMLEEECDTLFWRKNGMLWLVVKYSSSFNCFPLINDKDFAALGLELLG